jgi:hypothetical protein
LNPLTFILSPKYFWGRGEGEGDGRFDLMVFDFRLEVFIF